MSIASCIISGRKSACWTPKSSMSLMSPPGPIPMMKRPRHI